MNKDNNMDGYDL